MDTQKWTEAIDVLTNEFLTAFGGLTAEQLNAKPSPQSWSIAQNIHHLIVINQTYFPLIESVRSGTYQVPFLGKMKFMVRFLGDFILKSVNPDRRRKIKTFPLWEPAQSRIDGTILEQFRQHQEQLKQLIRQSSDLLDKGTVISSPANRNIVYRLDTAFDIIVTHERRHLEQARETAKAMGIQNVSTAAL